MDDYVIRREGKAVFYAPNPKKYDIYSAPVFYNPAMEKNRTLSVLLLKVAGAQMGGGLTVCEPLSGTGIRGIRYVVESGVVGKLILNDLSKEAVHVIQKNLSINGVEADVYNEDANVLLHKLRGQCDVVDVDPFGSPAPFLSAAFRALKNEGIVCATATDTAVLVGRYPRKCLRRYGSAIRKSPFYLEMGLRNLVGYVARVAASEDFAIRPLLSYWEGHYFRTCVYAVKSAKDADDMLQRDVGYVEYKKYRKVARQQSEYASGPVWISELGDPSIAFFMAKEGQYSDFLKLLEEEYSVSLPWFYKLPEFAVDGKSPTLEEAMATLRRAGVYTARTHMASDGFKAEATYGEVERVLRRVT